MSKRFTEQDIEALKERGFKVNEPISTKKIPSFSVGVDPYLNYKHLEYEEPKLIRKTIDYEMETILGKVPSKSNGYKIITVNGHGSLAKTKALKDYEENFFWQCKKYRGKNISVPFEFHMKVYYPSIRSDIDGSLKIILDLLQKVKAIKNDNRCSKLFIEKFVDKEKPRIEFKIIPV